MSPHEVAADEEGWRRYVHWLSHFRVVADGVQALAPPSMWKRLAAADPDNAASLAHLSAEERLLVVAWTWPDRRFDPAYDAYREVVLEPVDDVSLDKERGRTLSVLLGAELFATVGLVTHATGASFDDVVCHVLLETGMSAEHWELLTLGLVWIDVETLLGFSRALNLKFAGTWLIEDPVRLGSRIDRSAAAQRIIDSLRQIPRRDLLHLAEAAEQAKVADPDAEVDPQLFHNRLMSPGPWRGSGRAKERDEPDRCRPPRVSSKYYPLFELLDQNDKIEPTYTLDELDEAVASGGRDHDARTLGTAGLPEDAYLPMWWRNGPSVGHPQVRAWQGAGYHVEDFDATNLTVTFTEMPGRTTWWPHRESLRAGSYRPHRVPVQELYGGVKRLRFDTGWHTRALYLAEEVGTGQNSWLRYATRSFRIHTNPRRGRFLIPRQPTQPAAGDQ